MEGARKNFATRYGLQCGRTDAREALIMASQSYPSIEGGVFAEWRFSNLLRMRWSSALK